MKELAQLFNADADLWEITGVCHDLDFEVTKHDRSLHGLVAAEWMEGEVPETALDAIRAHDHRTGFTSETMLADALKFADAVAIGELTIGRETMLTALAAPDPREVLELELVERPYLTEIILNLSHKLKIPPCQLPTLIRRAPAQ
ncbi:MAG: hypothetical protein AB7P20_15235 [Rhizobiaceae bacterium]